MFGPENSIEPVRGEIPVMAARNTSRPAARPAEDEPPIREATAADLTAAARRQRTSPTPEPDSIRAAPETRGGLFHRRPVEAPQPDAVSQRHGFYVAEKRGTRTYFADYQQKQEIMRADGKRISTKLDDRQTVAAVLDLAEARGWNKVRLRGTEDFKREAWVQAQVRGIATEGYKPAATDVQEAERRKAAMGPVEAASPAASVKTETVPVRVTSTAPAAVQASTTAANDGEAKRVKAAPGARSKAVWGAVEATGKQARAMDAATQSVKATAGERSTAATTA